LTRRIVFKCAEVNVRDRVNYIHPRGGPCWGSCMVVADGRFRRASTTFADNRAMFEWRLWLARSQMSSPRNERRPVPRCHPSSAR